MSIIAQSANITPELRLKATFSSDWHTLKDAPDEIAPLHLMVEEKVSHEGDVNRITYFFGETPETSYVTNSPTVADNILNYLECTGGKIQHQFAVVNCVARSGRPYRRVQPLW